VVPAVLLDQIAAKAVEWASKDSRAREDISKGTPLLEALDTYGHL
jgi:hypothetical protein